MIHKVIDFVLMREKDEGGFGATPLLPPTIEDTYFAIKILALFNYSLNIEKHANFLLSQNISNLPLDPLAKLLKILNIFSLIDKANFSSLTSYHNYIKNLAEISFILKDEKNLKFLKSLVIKNLSKLSLKSLKEFYFLYKILREAFPKKFLESILEAQNADGGFGFFKGTTSYMENTYYACYILYRHDLQPKNLKKLKDFVLSCQNADGGFGRNSQGISFLESTYHALWILKNLNL
jgi:hypothetical protein